MKDGQSNHVHSLAGVGIDYRSQYPTETTKSDVEGFVPYLVVRSVGGQEQETGNWPLSDVARD